MGCGGFRANDSAMASQRSSDVCITSTNSLESTQDLAYFYSVWISKVCAELDCSVAMGRPHSIASKLRPGAADWRALNLLISTCRAVVCIVNVTRLGEWPPPGYTCEVSWAKEAGVPVVPFYDGDLYGWKDVCEWKSELPSLFHSGFGPVKYCRNRHERVKENLGAIIRDAIKSISGGQEGAAKESENDVTLLEGLSKSERGLLSKRRESLESRKKAAEKMGETRGLQRVDYERAGIVRKKLERTDSLRDINVEVALDMLAKRGSQGVDNTGSNDSSTGVVKPAILRQSSSAHVKHEPLPRWAQPSKGILKSNAKKLSNGQPTSVANAPPDRCLRLADPQTETENLNPEDRRYAFAVQQLQQHLDGLQAEDVHELMTVIHCLQNGLEEYSLITRSLRVIKAFLEQHPSLCARAAEQGVVQSITAAIMRHKDLDVSVIGSGCLVTLLDCGASSEALQAVGTLCVGSLARAKGAEVIANAMTVFQTCEKIQENGCMVFGLMCQNADDNKVSDGYKAGTKQESNVVLRSQARRMVVKCGGADLCVKTLRRFPANERLQVGGSMALGRIGLTASVYPSKRAAKDGGAIGAIVAAMVRHPRSADVQRWGCSACRCLSSNSPDSKVQIGARGGVQAICAAVKHFGASDHHVVSEGLGGLCHLASKQQENKKLIFDNGGIELAVAVLRAENPKIEIVMAGCGLLHNLACDEQLKRHIVKSGGRELAEMFMKNSTDKAVKNLARVLQRTLAPPSEVENDPFGGLFTTRQAGCSFARATSKRERKKAQAALQGVRGGEEDKDADLEQAPYPRQRIADTDDRSESGDSARSNASTASSAHSSYSGSGRRRPGQGKSTASSSRRFADCWDDEHETSKTNPDPRFLVSVPAPRRSRVGDSTRLAKDATLSNGHVPQSGPEPHAEHSSGSRVNEGAASDWSDAESHLSIEANDAFSEQDLTNDCEQNRKILVRRRSFAGANQV